MIENVQMMINKLNRYNTAHGWHFLASILTGGIWLIMWILFTVSNAIERAKITRKIEKVLRDHGIEHKIEKLLAE